MTSQLSKKEKDIFRLLQSNCHIASRNYNVQMKRFINHVNKEGVPIFNIDDIYERIRLAARVIAGVENLSEVYAISSRDFGQRAVIKFASHTKCSVTSSSRWTPGSLTNHQTKQFKEPRILIVTDPRTDSQAIQEASYVNIPVIAISAPAGLAMSSGAEATLTTATNLDLISQQSTQITAGKNLYARVKDRISLFAHQMGIKLIAASGKIDIQAHSDNIEMTTAKDLLMTALESCTLKTKKFTIITEGAT